jgi:hypothetical protein
MGRRARLDERVRSNGLLIGQKAHGAVDGQRPEPAQTVGAAASLVDATTPFALVDGVVRSILVDPGAEAGRADREGHSVLFRLTLQRRAIRVLKLEPVR